MTTSTPLADRVRQAVWDLAKADAAYRMASTANTLFTAPVVDLSIGMDATLVVGVQDEDGYTSVPLSGPEADQANKVANQAWRAQVDQVTWGKEDASPDNLTRLAAARQVAATNLYKALSRIMEDGWDDLVWDELEGTDK